VYISYVSIHSAVKSDPCSVVYVFTFYVCRVHFLNMPSFSCFLLCVNRFHSANWPPGFEASSPNILTTSVECHSRTSSKLSQNLPTHVTAQNQTLCSTTMAVGNFSLRFEWSYRRNLVKNRRHHRLWESSIYPNGQLFRRVRDIAMQGNTTASFMTLNYSLLAFVNHKL